MKYDYPRNLLPFAVTLSLSLFGIVIFPSMVWFVPLIPIMFGACLSGHMFYTDHKALQSMNSGSGN